MRVNYFSNVGFCITWDLIQPAKDYALFLLHTGGEIISKRLPSTQLIQIKTLN